MVRIVWTQKSLGDLNEIFDYIAKDAKRYASIVVDKIYTKIQKLVLFPSIGRIVPEFNDSDLREIIEGNFRIIYKIISPSEIHIIRIFHSSRLLSSKQIK